MAIPKRVAERLVSSLKRLTPVFQQQRDRDVSEADTVTLVKDFIAEALGYDKYSELTGEFSIRGTFCDLAIRLDGKVCQLIEVKAIGLALNDRHLKQAVDYCANQGIEWVILTNGVIWQLHHVVFSKPIESHLVHEINVLTLNPKSEEDIESLFLFTKEAYQRGLPADLRDRKAAMSRFTLASLLLQNDSVKSAIRRELRRIVDVNVSVDEIAKILEAEVIKRECLEGEEAADAKARVRRTQNKLQKTDQKDAEIVGSPGLTDIEAPDIETAVSQSTPALE